MSVIKVRRLKWLGGVARKERGRAVKTSLEGIPEGGEKKEEDLN